MPDTYINSNGTMYYLNKVLVDKKSGKRCTGYSFSRRPRSIGCELPADKQVVERGRQRFPVIINKEA